MRRRPDAPQKDEFIVLFTALSMILLAFFIMLNSMAVIDAGRSRKAMDSLIGTFGVMPGGTSSTPASIDSTSQSMRQNTAEALLGQVERGTHRGMSLVRKGEGQAVVELEGAVAFGRGDWRLNPAFFPQLDLLAGLIRSCRCQVLIAGHTDAVVPASGPSNFYLSGARAAQVREFLIDATGGDPADFLAQGQASNHLHQAFAHDPKDPRHRRVEITLRFPKESPSPTPPSWIEPAHAPE